MPMSKNEAIFPTADKLEVRILDMVNATLPDLRHMISHLSTVTGRRLLGGSPSAVRTSVAAIILVT